MVYLLKFGASLVLPPGIFLLAFAAVAVWLWRQGTRPCRRAAAVLGTLTVVFYLLMTQLVAERMMIWLESFYEPPAITELQAAQPDVIIMLGGGAIADSPDVDGTGVLCASPASRLLTVVRLQHELGIPVLLSGGQVYEDTGAEAKIARRVLMSLGVPEDMIYTETRSLTTGQNARYSAAIMREQGFTRPVLVTSAFHMRRSVLNFAKQGVSVIPYQTDYQTTHHPVFHYNKLSPSADALRDSVTVLRETLRYYVTFLWE